MSNEIHAVAILTTFQDLPTSYGLVPVVLNQIKQLVKQGWEVGFFTQAGFETHLDAADVPEGCELMPRVPFTHLYDYTPGTKQQKHRVNGVGKNMNGKPVTNFKAQVKLIEEALEPWLMEYPVVITHDIIFQTWFLPHNQAIRNIARRHPEIRWLHWLHSGPSVKPLELKYPHTLRHSRMTNSLLISPNDTMRQGFAAMYDVPLSSVRTVYHTFDPIKFFDMHPFSEELIDRYHLRSCDGLVVWATRVDHPRPKGMYEAIRLVAMMNRFADIKFLFLNSWSNSKRAKDNIESLKREAQKWGLPQDNLIFSSEVNIKYENGVPHQVVKDMMMIGDIFILPSKTETFSLAMAEAAACKNMLILNEDLGVFTELAGDRADYIATGSEWGGKKVERHYWSGGAPQEGETKREDPEAWWREQAHRLLARLGFVEYHCGHCGESLGKLGAYNPLRQHRHVLKYFNDKWVYFNQLQPLLEGS